MARTKNEPKAKRAGEAKEMSAEPFNRIQNLAQHPQPVVENPPLGDSSTTQKSAMSSTISQSPAEISAGTECHHPFDGELVKWTIQQEHFESASALRTVIHDFGRMIEICNLELQRLEATGLGFWEQQAIDLGSRVQVKTERPTPFSSARPSAKRQISPAYGMRGGHSKKARFRPRHRGPRILELTSNEEPFYQRQRYPFV
ncbi:hypothetical protein ANOM_009199 [Aspergillus nomiae NRRL 13137]|uniref:Uncharacterized protein n=1 Tax=Aspergillus nomiae NRRL (strain ATCC 15546 / NRRL 13137 / CBS 260.88 / M93) TaxID=1509407 RepID=A0A0L1IQ38_ASPN3|nr:uncharacterized protein ANOM_009199 [Aspergillus nomiae NRRL 13137]KNG81614.1 hypothetical protein ANOM_009199 [Aspergillus nomiae NRRL 13137]